MTGRYSVAGLAVWIVTGVILNAAEIWDKPFNTWTDVELKQMLTGSPWSGKGSISRVVQSGAEQSAIEDVAIVSWNSALIMRQAAVRSQMTAGAAVPKDVETALATPLEMYTIGVKVSGGTNSTSYARTVNLSQPETFLLRDGKPPLAPAQAEGRWLDKEGKQVEMPPVPPRGGGSGAPRGGGAVPQNGPLLSIQGGGGGGRGGGGGGGGGPKDGSALLLFAFPKSDAITLADKEVEFVTKLCTQSFGGGFGGGGAPGGSTAPPPGGAQFELSAVPQRGGGGGGGGGRAGGGKPQPPCNLNVKKKFKLKDLAIKGELAL